MHILVFPGWYPSRIDWLSGDFIQRHMQAISLNTKVTVVIAVKDGSVKKAEKVIQKQGNLTEIYYYYPPITTVKWLGNFFSFLQYNYICYQAFCSAQKDSKVDLVHLYVLQKNQLLGLLFMWLKKVSYIISEQSTFYVDGRLEKTHAFTKKLYRFIFNRSASFHAVSSYLLHNISEKLKLQKRGVVIPNVVNETLFHYQPKQQNATTVFVHVSNMVYQKNIEGMLQAFAKVKVQNDQFLLNLVGPLPAAIKTLITDLQLDNQVVTWHQQTYTEVANIMKQSDAFVFFTRFETFGCVIIEAGACGLPIILSDLEVTRELIHDKENGLLVENENVEDLSQKILQMMNGEYDFDRQTISSNTLLHYSYKTVSKQFEQWYQSLVKH